jgi:arginine deiminase
MFLLPLVSWGRDSGTGGIVDYRVGAIRDQRVGAADGHRMGAVDGRRLADDQRPGDGYLAGADSEVGRLRMALVHRPGPEFRRLTPRTSRWLGFADPPWVARAQQEHDTFTDVLREHGVEVVYLTGLLADVLEYSSAREEAIASVLADPDLGAELRASVARHLERLAPQDLAGVLIAGLTAAEHGGGGLVHDLMDPQDFVVEPLPRLVFSRDASVWIGDQAVVANLPGPRRREGALLAIIYRHHPQFTGLREPYHAAPDRLHGGDVLLLAPRGRAP